MLPVKLNYWYIDSVHIHIEFKCIHSHYELTELFSGKIMSQTKTLICLYTNNTRLLNFVVFHVFNKCIELHTHAKFLIYIQFLEIVRSGGMDRMDRNRGPMDRNRGGWQPRGPDRTGGPQTGGWRDRYVHIVHSGI